MLVSWFLTLESWCRLLALSFSQSGLIRCMLLGHGRSMYLPVSSFAFLALATGLQLSFSEVQML